MTGNLGWLKMQEVILDEKIKVASTLIRNVATLKQTKSRSHFMIHKQLGLKIYQF